MIKLTEIDHDILKVLAVLHVDKMRPTSKWLTDTLQEPHPGLTQKSVIMRLRKLQKHGLIISEDRGFSKTRLYWEITRTGYLTVLPDSDKAPKEQTLVNAKWNPTIAQYEIVTSQVV